MNITSLYPTAKVDRLIIKLKDIYNREFLLSNKLIKIIGIQVNNILPIKIISRLS